MNQLPNPEQSTREIIAIVISVIAFALVILKLCNH